jgi:hypothetical protein
VSNGGRCWSVKMSGYSILKIGIWLLSSIAKDEHVAYMGSIFIAMPMHSLHLCIKYMNNLNVSLSECFISKLTLQTVKYTVKVTPQNGWSGPYNHFCKLKSCRTMKHYKSNLTEINSTMGHKIQIVTS